MSKTVQTYSRDLLHRFFSHLFFFFGLWALFFFFWCHLGSFSVSGEHVSDPVAGIQLLWTFLEVCPEHQKVLKRNSRSAHIGICNSIIEAKLLCGCAGLDGFSHSRQILHWNEWQFHSSLTTVPSVNLPFLPRPGLSRFNLRSAALTLFCTWPMHFFWNGNTRSLICIL